MPTTPDPDARASAAGAAHALANMGQLVSHTLELSRVPRRLEVPEIFEGRFLELRRRVTERLAPFGLDLKDSLMCLSLEANEGIMRVGFLGNKRQEFSLKLDNLFGAGNWSFQHLIQGRLFPPEVAWRLYEDAYVQYFKRNPDKLEWLVTNFKDVIDNHHTNVESGHDYNHQEVPERGHHIHDIAIRRAVARLDKSFSGQEILKIRGRFGKGSPQQGFFLSPGEIPFHRPDLIPPRPTHDARMWWKEGSIEAFYQESRRLVVNEFTVGGSAPQDVLPAQSRPCYVHRVAARMLLRTLLVMDPPQVTLSEISALPWMLDFNSLPLGNDGLPRRFSDKEILGIAASVFEQVKALYCKSGKDEGLLDPSGWTSCCLGEEFVDGIKTDQEGKLQPQEGGDPLHDIYEVKSWSSFLPLFQRRLAQRGGQPLFLARDGLAVMEYLTYCNLLSGKDRATSNSELQHVVYLPGSPSVRSTRNQRAKCDLFDQSATEIAAVAYECRQELGLRSSEPVEDAQLRESFHKLFRAKIAQRFNSWRDREASDDPYKAIYEWWFDVYDSIRDSFKADLRRVTIVDSDGTGKTALFIKSLIEYFAAARGDEASVDIILGALQPNHIGVPNLVEEHDIHGGVEGVHLPDICWPFRFAQCDGEPVFNVRANPKNVLSLIYRSLSWYNTACDNPLRVS